jgi:hypothetical protein
MNPRSGGLRRRPDSFHALKLWTDANVTQRTPSPLNNTHNRNPISVHGVHVDYGGGPGRFVAQTAAFFDIGLGLVTYFRPTSTFLQKNNTWMPLFQLPRAHCRLLHPIYTTPGSVVPKQQPKQNKKHLTLMDFTLSLKNLRGVRIYPRIINIEVDAYPFFSDKCSRPLSFCDGNHKAL